MMIVYAVVAVVALAVAIAPLAIWANVATMRREAKEQHQKLCWYIAQMTREIKKLGGAEE